MRALWLSLGLTVGCVVPDAAIEGKPCPCPAEYSCDAQTSTCTRGAGAGGETAAGGAGAGAAIGGDGGGGSGPGPCGGTCGTAGCGACPTVAMVDAGGFLVDAYEATNADYAVFLADQVDPGLQSSACTWNDSFDPIEDAEADCPSPYDFSQTEFPITCVDWCDAAAFCAWAGKRMCGRVGGGTVNEANVNDPAQSEWYAACSAGGTLAFPYGDIEDGVACNTSGNGGAVVGTGWFPDCEGGFPGVFDMVGNAEEWEDSCTISDDPATDNCLLRGGAFWADATTPDRDYALCTSNIERRPDRSSASHDWGFRCCKDP